MRRAQSPIAAAQRRAVLDTVRALGGEAALFELVGRLAGRRASGFSRPEVLAALDALAMRRLVTLGVVDGHVIVRLRRAVAS